MITPGILNSGVWGEIGKGDKERLVPLPRAFGAVFGFWLKDRNRTEPVFAKADGKSLSPQAARAYLRGMVEKAGIETQPLPAGSR